MVCKICNNSDNKIFKIKEMMFDSGGYFDYLECGNCGCIQIRNVPEDMGIHYPSDGYYSFQDNQDINKLSIKELLIDKRDRYALLKDDKIGKILYKMYPTQWPYTLEPFFEALKSLELNRYSKILDVGCGAGHLLNSLNRKGFKNLMGLDPFIKMEIDGKIKILKKEIHELKNHEFDLIMFHHSFEHMYNQRDILIKLSTLLSEDGSCMVSMPVKTDYIWKLYGTNWVQIDAPRHFFIHTVGSFNLLAKKADFNIEKTIFNSSEFQFWGSEQYKKNISLNAGNSYFIDPEKSIFTEIQIEEFKNKAIELNKKEMGDQAIFILKSES